MFNCKFQTNWLRRAKGSEFRNGYAELKVKKHPVDVSIATNGSGEF